jgi:hypothetical protein
VRLNGSAAANDSVSVYFGSHSSPLVERQNGVVYATAPEGLVLGTTYDVRIVNRGGADTLLAAFTVVAPTITRVNGVTKPTGLIGMTVLIEGDAFGDARHGKVYFAGSGGTKIQAVIADSANDWANNFIVTTVPAGTPNTSGITVETATGTTASVSFALITGSTFSPSVINWTRTTDLPQPLQGLRVFLTDSAIDTAFMYSWAARTCRPLPRRSIERRRSSPARAAWSSMTTLARARDGRASHMQPQSTATGGFLCLRRHRNGATVNVLVGASLDRSGQRQPPLPGPLLRSRRRVRGFVCRRRQRTSVPTRGRVARR